MRVVELETGVVKWADNLVAVAAADGRAAAVCGCAVYEVQVDDR